jgi:hypothetical protein
MLTTARRSILASAIDHEAEYRRIVAERRARYDAANGAGAWDRAMHEIHFGPNLIAIGPSVQDMANGRHG